MVCCALAVLLLLLLLLLCFDADGVGGGGGRFLAGCEEFVTRRDRVVDYYCSRILLKYSGP